MRLHGLVQGGVAALLLEVVLTGCAHAPPPAAPRESACAALDDRSRPPRRQFPEPEWIVGVGHVSKDWTRPSVDTRAQAEADAQREIAAQVLVSVQSTLDMEERQTNDAYSSDARLKILTEIEKIRLPGIRQVQTCVDPATSEAVALAVLNRAEAMRAIDKMHKKDAEEISGRISQFRSMVSSGRTLQALKETSSLGEEALRFRSQSLMMAALGLEESQPALARDLQAALAELRNQRLVAVVRKGRAQEPVFAPLATEAQSAATASGWKAAAPGRELVRIEISVDECQAQPVVALNALRVRCPASFALVEAKTGEVIESGEAQMLEAVAGNRNAAVADAVRLGLREFAKRLRQTLEGVANAPAGR